MSLLMMAAICSPSMAAEDCLTRTQAEQLWPHSHLYWHTERRCWDATPVKQSHRDAYVSAAPGLPERQATTPVNYQVVERDGGTVWVKLPAKVTTYYPTLMKGQDPEAEWLTPTAVIDWPQLIDIDTPIRFAPWDRRISGIIK